MKKLIERINSEVPRHIHYLLDGGCGVFALTVIHLLKQYGIKYRIWALIQDGAPSFLERKRNTLAAIHNEVYTAELLPAEHFMIEAEGYVFDAHTYFKGIGNVPTDCAGTPAGEYTLEELEIAVKDGKWNPAYNHNQDAKLKELLETIFSETLNPSPCCITYS